ncbi:[FeFe] hydrogenase H-cluster radical SAM maturase HydG [Ethanoligenens harbinense]|uniref:Biotin and thiamin synthesis associated n=1 Tax=Ethanoligenens harbinense (strain DSM 18485 / JCM 12961 / CGMCC 1.5033 / YUAN-3) TaxID=663278 RepID=E6U649_ETHHY|nr:[FeFe] hydrogenase H-cluster radical SAM maturase HydG [Ethanoligenens harbinense]ADU25728.1 biotin and thiamin synthesis associated [Ethanoligenens harbinense YUAN-3]AVQ94898.1 [FeFe] hydrogenase H-cluster radical SAM maturase HydG [Ethanoligenens harbinense YUAN-3]AYF37589.1 [FeFe] hydrogenase H-cluster radical SAM maturase HydG [Ethanoligenens harbinense]AYF40309.1 [FeFe] hydrogenase H-cluster radical SAM maturase HydG [Ethanoligenens harbinense]QCN91146.1 [FeFe] hydrogenase H-cluster ra
MDYLKQYEDEMAAYDRQDHDFIDDDKIWSQLKAAENPSREAVRAVLQKAEKTVRLEPEETAILLQNSDPETITEMYELANRLKQEVYGDRIVFFAPLYISDECANDCKYCGFRRSNHMMHRKTLSMDEIDKEVRTMIREGQKRTVLVYGEAPSTGIDFLCKSIEKVYSVKEGNGEIRRANINAAPLSVPELRRLKEIGIGTFQVFQETYHHETYRHLHPANTVKGNYRWRLYAMDRALEAGLGDVGIGALFGLYDWRFEVMGLLYHTIHLEETFNGVGPHTISFPRITPATGTPFSDHPEYAVSDEDFKKLVAVLRLSVPYTGMICTARETKEVRDSVLPLGVSQIDGGTRIGVGGYGVKDANALPDKEQFSLGDTRSLDDVVLETGEMGNIPSFCTACYRMGRVGEEFMGLAKSKFVHHFCIPNAIFTFKEYLLDYAGPETREKGEQIIAKHVARFAGEPIYDTIRENLRRLENGERDLRV